MNELSMTLTHQKYDDYQRFMFQSESRDAIMWSMDTHREGYGRPTVTWLNDTRERAECRMGKARKFYNKLIIIDRKETYSLFLAPLVGLLAGFMETIGKKM